MNRKIILIIGLLIIIVVAIVIIFRPKHIPLSSQVERIDLGNYSVKNRPRVVVSFTTIPSRVGFVHKVIEKLQMQSMHPDMVYICIPYHSKRLKKPYSLPENTNFGPKVKIVRCEDFGPATKLLGCLEHELDPETAIITIDDDQNYHRDTLKTLTAYAIKYPDKVVAFRTLDKELSGTGCVKNKNILSPHAYYAEGFGGVLYKRKFLTKEMVDYFNNLSEDCFVSDDLVISAWMEVNNIGRLKLCDFTNTSSDDEIDSNNALHREKRDKVYNNCRKEMKILIYRKESEKLLHAFHTMMSEHKIPYIIAFGTLLGAVREKNFIDTDHDIDVIIFEQDLPRYLLLKKAFEKVNIKITYTDHIHRLEFDKNSVNSYMDVFVYKEYGDKYIDIDPVNRSKWSSSFIYKSELFPLKSYNIASLTVSGPNKPEYIFDRIYGDWKTPRDSQDYVSG